MATVPLTQFPIHYPTTRPPNDHPRPHARTLTKMKLQEFEIGKTFWCGGRPWLCADIGTRVIVAIRLDYDDPSWYNGPSYALAEQCFEFDTEGLAEIALLAMLLVDVPA